MVSTVCENMVDVRRILRQLYDEEALSYAAKTDSYLDFPGLRDDVDAFAAQVERVGYVLDLGAGPGRDSRYLESHGFSVVAVDFSMEMLHISRSLNASHVQADMVQLPFLSNSFAGAWVCASLLHLPIQDQCYALSELLRVLKSGGMAAISMKAGQGAGWTEGCSIRRRRWFTLVNPAEFVATLGSTGFVKISWSWCNRGSWFIVQGSKR